MDIILSDFISLDGVIQAPGHPDEDRDGGFEHGGWSHPFFDADVMGPVIGEVMGRTDALLFGRKTFEGMRAAFGGGSDDPFAQMISGTTKYVASRTLSEGDLAWENSHLLDPGDAIGAVRELREQSGAGLQVLGCASISQQLIAADLVDELWLMIEPITLGGGKSIWPTDGVARTLTLSDSRVTSTGVIVCQYTRPATGASSGAETEAAVAA